MKVRRLESWKVGKLEGWKVGRLEGWKVGRLEGSRGFVISPVSRNFHRAERRRREARREKCTHEKCTLPTIPLGSAGRRPVRG